MAALTFYTHPMSRGRIVRWMLEEVGAPYATVPVAYGEEMKAPGYRALNPMGKVPALVHHGTVVTECAAICAYLADAFPEAGLAPPPAERGGYYRWLFFGAGPVEAAVTNAAMGWHAEEPQHEARLGYGSLAHVLDTLDAHLQGRAWFLDSGFSTVDVYLGSQIAWGLTVGTMGTRPAFEAYVARLQSRPAATRAREKDEALMPAAPAGTSGGA